MRNKKTKETWKRLIAYVLVAVMFFTSVPLEAMAVDVADAESTEHVMESPEEIVEGAEDEVQPHILAEVESERSETTKTFRMSDGSYTVATYEQPVHYESEEGIYEEIDNTFVEEESSTFRASEDTVYRNRAGKTNIQFREKRNAAKMQLDEGKADVQSDEVEIQLDEEEMQSDESEMEMQSAEADPEVEAEAGVESEGEGALEVESPESTSYEEVSMEVDGQVISWSYEDMAPGQIAWEESKEDPELTGDEKFLTVPNAVSTGVYEDAFEGTDLQYVVSPEGIKENIILKDKKAGNVWKLTMDIGSFTAVQEDEQTVALYGEAEEPVLEIAAPLMTDKEGKISTGVTLSMEQEESTLRLTVTADREFLQDANTTYPVTVDPYFYLVAKSDISISDTFLSSAKPSSSMRVNGVATGSLIVGREESTYGKTRSLLKMDTLPKLPAGSVITQASLILLNYYSYSAGKSMSVDVRRATASWSPKTATWNSSSGSYENLVQDYYVVPENEYPTNKFDTWEITRLVKGWYEGTYPNYGIMMTSFAAETAPQGRCTKYIYQM